MDLKEIRNNTPLNPLLIEGTLVGRFWVRGVEQPRDIVFGKILRVLQGLKNPLLIEGTLVGRFWVRGVEQPRGIAFGKILRVLRRLKNPLLRGVSRSAGWRTWTGCVISTVKNGMC